MHHMTHTAALLASLLSVSLPASAQHGGHDHAQMHNPAQEKSAATPYAGEQSRAIKSLSADDMRALQKGDGMGLAKAAELNGYPGPMHVLEHADALKLTPEQRSQTSALMQAHKARAAQIGTQLIAAEQALDAAFASRQIDEARLATLTADIGRLQASLRAEHLGTHLKQTALLSETQTRTYAALRGYTPGAQGGNASGHRH